jgi:hypothetical protein
VITRSGNHITADNAGYNAPLAAGASAGFGFIANGPARPANCRVNGGLCALADAGTLVAFAKSRHLGMLSFWELTRDRNACTRSLVTCTNVAQTPYQFSQIFAGFTG